MSSSFTAAFNLIFLNIIPNLLRLFIKHFKFKWCQKKSQVIIMVLMVISMFACTQITRFM